MENTIPKRYIVGGAPGSPHFDLSVVGTTNIPEGYKETTYEEAMKLARQHANIMTSNRAAQARGERVVGVTGDPTQYLNQITTILGTEPTPLVAEWTAPWIDPKTGQREVLTNIPQATINEITKNYGTQGYMSPAQFKVAQPPSPTPTNGQVEIKTDGAPPLPTGAGDVVAAGNGATTAWQKTIDDLQKAYDDLRTQQTQQSEETKAAKKSWLGLIKKGEEVRAERKSAVELRQEALTQAYSEMGVTPEQVQKIGGLIGQVTTYNQQIADIETRKQIALDKTETLGMSAGYIAGEQNRLSKQYNSEISAKALQAGVKVQELQMIQGAYDDAKATAAQIVNLATYDQQQEVADIEWSLNAYQDLYNLLSGEEQTQWNRQYTMAKDALDTARTTMNNVSKYVTDPTTADAFKGIDWTTLTEQEAIELVGKYTQSPAYLQRVAAIGAAGRAPETTGGATVGFKDAKVEADFRESGSNMLDDGMSVKDAYTKLRRLYSKSEVTDQAIKDFLGIVEEAPPEVPLTPQQTAEQKGAGVGKYLRETPGQTIAEGIQNVKEMGSWFKGIWNSLFK